MKALPIRCTRSPLSLLLAAALCAAAVPTAHADSVTDWNALASGGAVVARFGGPYQQFRALAIVQIAVHDALNSITPRYRTYNAVSPAGSGASADAAVAAATRTTLLAMLGALPAAPTPAEAAARAAAVAAINAMFDAALGPGAFTPAEAAGVAAGDAAANAIIAARYNNVGGVLTPNDGSGTPHSPAYALAAAPGVHQATPALALDTSQPNPLTAPPIQVITIPQFMGWPFVRPFAVNSASQFRVAPGAIFNLGSTRYASEFNQVKHQGSALKRGAFPNSEQSDIARFWAGGGLDWNGNARLIASGLGLDRWQHARMLALMNLSQADAALNNIDSKYHYNFWRPVTAIRWANDGNAATISDPNWRPFLATPPYPDYPCGSTSATGGSAGALRLFFGTNSMDFTRTVTAPAVALPPPLVHLPPKTITRVYGSLSHAENEVARSRVYAGFHFIEGCYAGLQQGNSVASYVFANYLRPL